MKQSITITGLFLAVLTSSVLNALTVINKSQQSFIIDYEEHSEQQFCLLLPTQTFEVYPSSDFLTITLRNPERPDGRFSGNEINNHTQAIINAHEVSTIKITTHPDLLFDQAIHHFFIFKVNPARNCRLDSGMGLECPPITSSSAFPLESELLGIITQMDYDFSSIRKEKYCPSYEFFQHHSDPNSAVFE